MAESYLKAYFNLIAAVACDKAKEHAEKKKASGIPAPLQAALLQFAQCEKNYFSLVFLEQKWFGRRDPLKSTYLALHNDLKNVAKQEKLENSQSVESSVLSGSLCDELSNYCQCRSDCIELYEQCLRTVTLKDLENSISELMQKYERKFQHPVLKPISASFLSEFETFKQLVSTSILITDCNFFPSLMGLHKIHQTLIIWQPLLNKEQHNTYSFRQGLFGFGEKHGTSSVSAVYQWMAKYFQSLVSKFSFYFFEFLNRQGKPDEMKTMLGKTSYDFISKSLTFCRKLDQSHILLIPASSDTSKSFEDFAKIDFPKMLELPNACPEYVYPDMLVFLKNKADELSSEKLCYYYSKQVDFTFYAAQTDPGMNFVVVVFGRKTEKDSHILNFINEVVGHTRPKRVFSLLRPGTK